MLSPKDFNFMTSRINSPIAKIKLSSTSSQSPMRMDIDDTNEDLLSQIKQQDIIPELFQILHDLRSGKILAKDFDNKLGSIRLKLTNTKSMLRQIDGITESMEERQAKIESLSVNNQKKIDFLNDFKQKVTQELE